MNDIVHQKSDTVGEPPEVQALCFREVQSEVPTGSSSGAGGDRQAVLTWAAVIAATAKLMASARIDIPRIVVMPKGEVKAGFRPSPASFRDVRYPAPSEELWARISRTDQIDIIGLTQGNLLEERLEDYVVSGLIDFPDVAYDEHADLLYDLAGQVVRTCGPDLSEEEVGQVLALHQRESVGRHPCADAGSLLARRQRGISPTSRQGFTETEGKRVHSPQRAAARLRVSPADKSATWRDTCSAGFSRCSSNVIKFQSESERKLAVILEREALKWLRPAKAQFQMFYRSGNDDLEYQPDFVAEMDDCIVMLESKRCRR